MLGRGHEPDDRPAQERERGLDRGKVRVEREREVQDAVVRAPERGVPDVDEHVGLLAREVAGPVARVAVERDRKAPGLQREGERDAPSAKAVRELERDSVRPATGEFGRERLEIDAERVRGRARSPSRSP